MKNKQIIIIVLAILFLTGSLFSQYSYFYGKNKVKKRDFKWKVAETEHFNIHYYTENEALIRKIAVKAEKAYTKISLYLSVNAHKKIPIIYYNTHIDFEMTNLFPGFMPLGIQAFAEPIGHRVVMHGDMPFEDFSKTLTHELGHIFEYLVWYGKTTRRMMMFSRQPLWVAEGFSEFVSTKLEGFEKITVIDNVVNDKIPELSKSTNMQAYTNRTPYDFGLVMYEFIDEKWGPQGVKKVLNFYKSGSFFRFRLNAKGRFFKLFGTSRKEFNFMFKKYLRKRFKKYMDRESPDDYSYNIGPEIPYTYTFGHNISPSGELAAILTYNIRKGRLEVILISMKDGRTIRSVTPGFPVKYDGIDVKFNPTDGISFTWDNSGEKIFFFARKEYENYLVVFNVLTSKMEQMIKLKNIQAPASPDYHPENGKLYFTGIDNFVGSIFSYDFKSGKTEKLTHSKLYIKSLNISPDGKKFIYSAKAPFAHYNLYMAPIDALDTPQMLTNSDFDDITPSFSTDGKSIFYSSNELESYNVYKIDLANQTRFRLTNVKTGNFFPLEIPGEEKQIAFTSFYKGVFYLYKKNSEDYLSRDDLQFSMLDKKDSPPAAMDSESEEKDVITAFSKYNPFKDFSISGSPSISFGLTTQGDFFGYTSVSAIDLLGDQRLTLTLGSYYGYRNYSLSYVNLKNRLQYYITAFSFTEPYYTYSLYDSRTLRKVFGLQSGLYFPFNRSYRAELGVGILRQEENTDLLYYGTKVPYGQYFTGYSLPISVSLVGDSIYFSGYQPNRGETFKLTYSKYIGVSDSFIDAYSASLDYRKYISLGANTSLAFRFNGFYSGGKVPLIRWAGGGNTIRASTFSSIIGTRLFFINLEFRFPIIHVALTPIGLMGPVKGVFFFDMGGAWFKEQDYHFFEKDGGLKLQDGLASMGFGLQAAVFGYPLHFDWIWKTNFKDTSYYGFKFWIGFDF